MGSVARQKDSGGTEQLMITQRAGGSRQVHLLGALRVDGFEEPLDGQAVELAWVVAQRQRIPGRAGMGRRLRHVDAEHVAQCPPHPGRDWLTISQVACQSVKLRVRECGCQGGCAA